MTVILLKQLIHIQIWVIKPKSDLMKSIKSKTNFNSKIQERTGMNKKLSKYIAALDYFEKSVILLFAASGVILFPLQVLLEFLYK